MPSQNFRPKNTFKDVDRDRLFDHYGAAARGSGIFGLSCERKDAAIVLLPVPWEVTVSYGGGAAKGPESILAASTQLDLYDRELGSLYDAPIVMADAPKEVRSWNDEARPLALTVLEAGGITDKNRKAAERVKQLGDQLNALVYREMKKIHEEGKVPGLVGGDHSTPLGAIKAAVEAHPGLGILHIDAHSDSRHSFEDLQFSHGSIMRNVMETTPVKKLVQVAIRDFCKEEMEFIRSNSGRMTTFFDEDLAAAKAQGKSWQSLCDAIVKELPKEVYVSWDIDGLDPSLCPHTGTPVPGGLSWNEALLLLKTIVKSGRRIVGFDLIEVSPGDDEWDANVGARLLFKLCGWTLKVQE